MEINREEKEFKWFEAAKSYEEEMGSSSRSILSQAEYRSRIGFCYSLASRQAADSKKFDLLRQLAIEAYERAAQLYIEANHISSQAKSMDCLSKAEYNRSWLASDSAGKRKDLEKAISLAKKAREAFRIFGDDVDFARTCTILAQYACELHVFKTTSASKTRVIREGLSDAEMAIPVFSDSSLKGDLLKALALASLLCVSLAEVSDQEKNKTICGSASEYAKRAVDLSKSLKNPYDKILAFWAASNYTTWFEEEIEKRRSLEYPKEMLKQASFVGDRYLKGMAYHHLAYALYADVREEADPEEKKQKLEDIIDFSKSAERYLQIVRQHVETATTYLFYAESSLSLAQEFVVSKMEKLAVVKKAITAGEQGLEYALKSGSPYAIQTNLIGLSRIYHYSSLLEQKKEAKIKKLRRALSYKKREATSTRKTFPRNTWYTGVAKVDAALIEADLARLETNVKRKQLLLLDATTKMEQGVAQCKKTLEFADVPAVRVRIADYEETLGGMMEDCFSLTGDKESLLLAVENYLDAASCFRKIDLPSRAAESLWKIARNQDHLGLFEKASKSFEDAHDEFAHAALNIPQFSDFYLDYATYVEAWSEIEKGKLAHISENYALAQKHYDLASNYLRQSKSWMHLASNFYAWSLLEKGEDLSRKENSADSIKAFKEAILLLRDSKLLLSNKLPGIKKADERELTERLVEVSEPRARYSEGRIAVEEAKILDKQGNSETSSAKYGAAAEIFGCLLDSPSEQIRNEAKTLFYLCQAWNKLTMAEAKVSSTMYVEAAELFKLANEYALNEPLRFLSLAHGSFSRAMGAGTEFELTRDTSFYFEAKKFLDTAASYYLKAGFEAFSEYTKATQRLFDAYFFMDSAKRETDPAKEAKYYLMAEKVLEVSGTSFQNANYTEKANQVSRLIEKVKEERELALSLSEVLHAHSVTTSTSTFGTLSLVEENPVGLERFAHADIQAKLIKEEGEIRVGDYVNIKVQIGNVGKEPVLLTSIEGLSPLGVQIVGKPDYCFHENTSLILKGRHLGPLKTEEISLVVRPFKRGSFAFNPTIAFVDETGHHLFCNPEGIDLIVLETVLPARLSTGFPDLDDLLLGGIPENYAVVLSSPSTDEREVIINHFLIEGARNDQMALYITSDGEGAKALAKKNFKNLLLFFCKPSQSASIEGISNITNLSSVENLTELNISIFKALRAINNSKSTSKRICIGILSEVLLQHHVVLTRKWLNSLLLELKSRGFTTLAILNRDMHPKEEVESVLSQFDGEIQIFEKETGRGLDRILRVRRLHGQRFMENKLPISKEV